MDDINVLFPIVNSNGNGHIENLDRQNEVVYEYNIEKYFYQKKD